MANKSVNLTAKLYKYMLDISLNESAIQKKCRLETAKITGAAMQISPEQGQFMALLVKLMNAEKAIEIGTFTGYSALSVALALPDEGKIVCCELNKEQAEITKNYSIEAKIAHKMDIRVGPALKTLSKLLETDAGSFDFAFIDADKRNNLKYYEACLTLLRPGGLIIMDNVFYGGEVIDSNINDETTNTIRHMNQKIHIDPRVFISTLPISDGITLALKL